MTERWMEQLAEMLAERGTEISIENCGEDGFETEVYALEDCMGHPETELICLGDAEGQGATLAESVARAYECWVRERRTNPHPDSLPPQTAQNLPA